MHCVALQTAEKILLYDIIAQWVFYGEYRINKFMNNNTKTTTATTTRLIIKLEAIQRRQEGGEERR